MKVTVQVKPNSKMEGVNEENKILIVKVNCPPVDGQANKRARELLAQHFKVSKGSVILLKGRKSRSKVFEIEI